MAISTYDELKTALANWLDRTDLTSRVPEFITLGEAVLNRELRTRTMETNASLTTASGSRVISLTSNVSRFLEPIALFIERDSGREELTFVPSDLETSATDGEPQFWTIDGTDIAFEREADAAYNLTLKYLKKLDIATDTTNWLLSNYPDAYLSAAMAEGSPFVRDGEDTMLWTGKRDSIITSINRKEGRSRAKATLRTELTALVGAGGSYNINSDQ